MVHLEFLDICRKVVQVTGVESFRSESTVVKEVTLADMRLLDQGKQIELAYVAEWF